MELILIFIQGIMNFIISGLDDFILMLIIFNIARDKYNISSIGIFFSLNIIIIISLFFGYYSEVLFYKDLNLIYLKNIHYLVYVYIFFILISFIFKITSGNFTLNQIKWLKQKPERILVGVAVVYILQGIDDFIIYTSMFLKLSIEPSIIKYIIYILGINFGLFIFWISIKIFNFNIEKIFRTKTK